MTPPDRVLACLSAYACEGGLDSRHQPATCFSPTIALGRHHGPGDADGLWSDYEAVVDLAARSGLGGVCLEVSWARLEPRRARRDEGALARYAAVVELARARGLRVGVAAIDAAWPAWLGQEAWLMPWVVPVALEYLSWLRRSIEADSWSLFAQRESLTRGFTDDRAGPPWRHGAKDDERSARANLGVIESLARDTGERWVTAVNIELDDVSRVDHLAVEEVHVRSLVRGAGPLASARGLLARRAQEWVLVDEVPAQMRRP